MYKTEQEKFWEGKHGSEWVERNDRPDLLPKNIALFSRILAKTEGVKSVLEFGAGFGANLKAIQQLIPGVKLEGSEINWTAIERLTKIDGVVVIPRSILDITLFERADLVIAKAVLIHVKPERLPEAYEALYRCSKRYVLVAEYYNPTPVEVEYRGRRGVLFKRDFAGEIMDKYPDIKLVDYGFAYHRDNNFPQDDLNWFLLEKNKKEGNV